MPSKTTRRTQDSTDTLFVSFELSLREWKLGFAMPSAKKIQVRKVPARDLEAVTSAFSWARTKFELSDDARIVSCYEAGRDGFWLHRALKRQGVDNHVVDPASIEVNRRGRRAKTDRLDARKLVTKLVQYCTGDREVWRTVRVPALADEDARHLHRELRALKQERTRTVNRIKGLLIGQGLHLERLPKDLDTWLESARTWDERRLPRGLVLRVQLENRRRLAVAEQIAELEACRRELLRQGTTQRLEKVKRLHALKGIGEPSAWLLVMEFFGWRRFSNRKQVGALAGLVPTPHQSGEEARDRGISKTGNTHVRGTAVELAWAWLRYQPESELSRWYQQRFAQGGRRLRKIGIVALARKLLVSLWEYLDFGRLPNGAELKA